MSKLKKVKDREFIYGELPLSKDKKIIWKETVGKKFSIRYDGNVYNFIVTKYDNKNRIVYFVHNGEEYHMYTSGLLKCNIGFITGLLTTNFKYNIGDIINGYEILEQTRLPKNNGKSYRAYKVRCIKDNYLNTVSETGLDRGDGCPVCDNKIIVQGINDMWTTNPELASLLENPNDGYLYSQSSNMELNWKCPFCKSIIKNKTPSYIGRYNKIYCPYCGDGYSYPEKMMCNILTLLKVDFDMHYRIPHGYFVFKGKKYIPEYDFYFKLDNKQYIIEMDGGFHYKTHSKSEMTLSDIENIDKNKDILADKNGIILIRIDCKISEYDYIFNSIQQSILNNLFDLSKIDKIEINKKAYGSYIVDACRLYMTKSKNLNTISSILKIPYGTIYNYLKRGAEIGICDYDPVFSLKNKGHLDFVGTYEVIL